METSLPEIPIKMETVQLINQLLKQLTTKPSNKIYPTPFSGTAAENILDSKGSKGLTRLLHIMYVMKNTALNFLLIFTEANQR